MRIEKTEWGYASYDKVKNVERQCGTSIGCLPCGLTKEQEKELEEKGRIEVPDKK